MKNSAFIIKLLLSLGMLAIFALRMDMATVHNVISHISAAAWVYATLLILGQFCFLSKRWQVLLNIGHRHVGFADSAKITLASMLANLILITSVGGIFVRIAMAVQHGAHLLKSFIATAVDRMMTLAALVLLCAVFLPVLSHQMNGAMFHTFSLWVSVFTVVAFFFTPVFIRFIGQSFPGLARSDRRIRYGLRYLKVLFRSRRVMAATVVTSLVAQVLYFLAVYCIALSTGANVTFLPLMAVLPVVALISSLPIGIGGWGVREGAFIFGLGLLGIPMETAFLISVQIGLIGMITTLIAGLPMIMTMDLAGLKKQAGLLMARLRTQSVSTKR